MTTDAVPEWWFMGPSASERPSSPKETMTDGRVLEGVEIDETATIQACRSCGKPIWFGKTAAGRVCPFDVIGRERTAQTHFSTCKTPELWSRKR